ncbi:MAG: SAM-dependent methyltransferase [Phycisphaerales bacterium]|nr:SAM-dependent methyltransferase [Phycisphaerales bacterium]
MSTTTNKSFIYLIPLPIGDNIDSIHQQQTAAISNQCTHFFTENEKTARRFLKKCNPAFDIDGRQWFSVGNNEEQFLTTFKNIVLSNTTIGILSESGCPCIADPGAQLINMAHALGAIVKPMVGPNSVTLALMASGLGGQKFYFHGYLPIAVPACTQKIKQIELQSFKEELTQIFIETPYRSQNLWALLLRTCTDQTQLCVASNLLEPDEQIITLPIKEWKKKNIDITKKNCIFLLRKFPG